MTENPRRDDFFVPFVFFVGKVMALAAPKE